MAPKITTLLDDKAKVLHYTMAGAPGENAVILQFPYHPLLSAKHSPPFKGYVARLSMPASHAAVRCMQSQSKGMAWASYQLANDFRMIEWTASISPKVDAKAVAGIESKLSKVCASMVSAVQNTAEGIPVPKPQKPTDFQTGTYQLGGDVKADAGALPGWAWIAGLGAVGWLLLGRRR